MKVWHSFSKALARLGNPMGFEFFLRHFASMRTSYSICCQRWPPKLLTVFNLHVDVVSLNSTIFFFKEILKLCLVLLRWHKLLFPNIHIGSWFSSQRGRAWQCRAAEIWWVSGSWTGTILAAVSKVSTQNEGMWMRVHSCHPNNTRIVPDTSIIWLF